MKKIAVILSGCGMLDGTEIQEAVLTLLAIDKAGASYECLAPTSVKVIAVNHVTKAPEEPRQVHVEAARIARGHLKALTQANPADYDALIFPGGFGAAKVLCNFAEKKENCTLLPEVETFAKALISAHKPLGFICVAPVMIPKLYPAQTLLTIGTDEEIISAVEKMGAKPLRCSATEIVVDKTHKVVSTPAYMLAQRISETATGIERLVREVLALT